ncbi:metallophosphoesterase [Sphingomonas oleivorans]|uniref:Metallophosphoesterase n=1 Tax=Sphingomonas oleivorans TaxID=1735121 RepID=A0A2T5G1V7_9SPHN|nr:metallophosphoesterase [Sphingomonas oleivorans]PTQ13149.1 metallophosphoesterase [Sphingomonas oleivorans]
MSRSLFNFLWPRRPTGRSFRLPEGLRVYAVGDVHGRLDCLSRIEQAIGRHREAFPEGEALVIFLGDYIDRGGESRGVIDALLGGRFAGMPARFLMGNHEDAMLHFLDDPAVGPIWFAYGGMATLVSYGVRPEGAPGIDRMNQLRLGLLTQLPVEHRRFLESLELWIQLGDYLFVHAGIRPGRPLAAQQREDLLMIREPFLSTSEVMPWRVVHGHTVVEEPLFAPNRIAVDTGAYATGVLSCVVIEADRAERLVDE